MWIQFAASPWYILVCFSIAIFYSSLLYYKNKNEYKSLWLYTLASLRFVLVFFMCLLLLSPLLKIKKERVQKPILIVGLDHSNSIQSTFTPSFTKEKFQEKIEDFILDLKDKFEVKTLAFSGTTETTFDYNFDGLKTDYGLFFNEVKNHVSGKQIGAIVMLSDGNYNSGQDPYSAYTNIGLPLHTVNLGDTLVFPDLRIAQVQYNEQALIGNEFPLQILIEGIAAKNSKNKFEIFHNEQVIYSQEIEINSSTYSKTIHTHLKANELGLQTYTLQLSPLKGEKNTQNNKKNIYVQVVDQTRKILILAAAPHPDISAIKQSLSSFKTNQVDAFLASEFKGSIASYSCIVLHQLPTKINKYPFVDEIMSLKKPSLFIIGKQSELSAFNTLNIGLQIQAKGGVNAALPYLAGTFPYFLLNENWNNTLNTLPPLETQFGNYEIQEGVQTLIYQKILNIKTQEPLWVFANKLGHRVSILCGEGIWKWKLHEYQQTKENIIFNDLLEQTSLFLGSSDATQPLLIKHPTLFTEDQDVILNGEFLNASFQYDNTAELKINISDSIGKTSSFLFSPVGERYELNAGDFPVGKYKYIAELHSKDKTHNYKGSFHIIPLQIENSNEQARPYILSALSKNNGGENFFLENLDELKHLLLQEKSLTSVVFEDKSILEGIHLKWLFFVLLILLSVEWGFRKYLGSI